MKKQKKIFAALLSLWFMALVVIVTLFVTKIIGVTVFVCAVLPLLVIIGVNLFILVKIINKIKKQKQNKKEVVETGDSYRDLYKILGIPVQYNSDGSVKSIYDLLDLETLYDENGNRLLTVYEMLGMAPKFSQEAKEIPLVFVIKNRVGRVAKVDLTTRVLTRKMTESQKEELLIREMLTKKLKEAEQQQDLKQQEKLKQLMANVKKATEPPKANNKEVKFIIEKGGGAISGVKLSQSGSGALAEGEASVYKMASEAFALFRPSKQIAKEVKSDTSESKNNSNENVAKVKSVKEAASAESASTISIVGKAVGDKSGKNKEEMISIIGNELGLD